MCDRRSSQLTVAMATNLNINNAPALSYLANINILSSTYSYRSQFLILPLLLSAPHSKAVVLCTSVEHPVTRAAPGRRASTRRPHSSDSIFARKPRLGRDNQQLDFAHQA